MEKCGKGKTGADRYGSDMGLASLTGISVMSLKERLNRALLNSNPGPSSIRAKGHDVPQEQGYTYGVG